MPGLHSWFADLSANFAEAQTREIPQPLSYDLSTGAVATLRVMPSYSAFSLRLTLRAIRGSTPLTARFDQPIIALRALFGLYCASPLSVRFATDLGCLSLGTGHVFCFIRQKPFSRGRPFGHVIFPGPGACPVVSGPFELQNPTPGRLSPAGYLTLRPVPHPKE